LLRTLCAAGQHSTALTNYGILLEDIHQDYRAATRMYQRALASDPRNIAALCQYSSLLGNVEHDFEKGEALLRAALLTDANNHDLLQCLYSIKNTRKALQSQKPTPQQEAARKELERRRVAKVAASRRARRAECEKNPREKEPVPDSDLADEMAKLLLEEELEDVPAARTQSKEAAAKDRRRSRSKGGASAKARERSVSAPLESSKRKSVTA
jgi:tetratricopeptide (TPR) repeat protein